MKIAPGQKVTTLSWGYNPHLYHRNINHQSPTPELLQHLKAVI